MESMEEFQIEWRKMLSVASITLMPNRLYSYDLGYRLTINPSQVHNKASPNTRIFGLVQCGLIFSVFKSVSCIFFISSMVFGFHEKSEILSER